MSRNPNTPSLWTQAVDFFGSVKVALFLLLTLAATSIIGTVLPQEKTLDFFEDHYTPISYKLIRFFQLHDTYHSWWFQWLLLFLIANLLVCSLKRLPSVWKVARSKPRSVSERLFETLPFHRILFPAEKPRDLRRWILQVLGNRFGRPRPLPCPEGEAFYLERWRFSRFGVYLVHLSVLIILSGGLIGSWYGFKGFIELKEGEKTEHIQLQDKGNPRPLGFSVRLEKFTMAFYPDGTPKDYRSDLMIQGPAGEIQKAVVRVNSPFTYRGVTFYQSSWDKVPLALKLQLQNGASPVTVSLEPWKQTPLPRTDLSLLWVGYHGNLARFGPALALVLLKGSLKKDMALIMVDHPDFHGNRIGGYRVKVLEQRSAFVSGFQVNRDPGVWFIWVGASLMLIGLIVTFYLSHQQIWIWCREDQTAAGGPRWEIRVGGTSHKHRTAFFHLLERRVEHMKQGE